MFTLLEQAKVERLEEMSSKQKKGFPIGATIIIIVLVAILFMVGNLTCEKWDAGESEFVLLGVILTGGIFALLVVIVKALMKGDDSEE